MTDSEKLAIAAHLHVLLRRKTGRVTDVEWLVRSPEYAREIIRIALAEAGQPELTDWAQRLHDAFFTKSGSSSRQSKTHAAAGGEAASSSTSPRAANADSRVDGAGRYIGRLR